MASRGKYGARFLGHIEREDSRERRAPSPSKRLSAVSTASSASKIPAYTSSFFSRHKNPRNEIEPMKITGDASSKEAIDHTTRPYETTFMRRTESPVKPTLEPPRTLGLGIATGNSLGSPITPVNSEKRPRNVLRRKASGLLDQKANYARTESSVSSYDPAQQRHETSSNPGTYRDPFAGSILGVTMPAVSSPTSFLPSMTAAPYHQATSSSRMAMYNPRSTPDQLSMRNLSPPTTSFAHSSGSSTRRSESPGGFSRTSTPTSMSSHSPGIPLPTKSPLGVRQSSPTRSRPPVTRRGLRNLQPHDDAKVSENQGLSVLRESGTSSSSSSTVKGIERVEVTQVRNLESGLSPPPPSPPPRVSSKQPLQLQDDFYHARNPLTTADVLQRRPPLRSQTTGETGLTKNVFISPSRPFGAPPRPSREGTPKLESGLAPSPIIRSNLRGLVTTGNKRRESLEKSITSPETRHAAPGVPRSSTMPVKPQSRLPSPAPGSIGTSSRPRPPLVFPIKDVAAADEDGSAGRAKDPSPLSAGPNKSSSRFGLFARRTKSPLEANIVESSERGAKKGPTAGTGHEGYGKYAAKRGRTGSVSTNTSRGRSTSTGGTSISVGRTPTSRKSSITSRGEPEMDDFLLDRLAPVVISGGGGFSGIRDGSGESYRRPSEDDLAGRTVKEALGIRSLASSQVDLPNMTSDLVSTDPELDRRRSMVFAERSAHSPVRQNLDLVDQPRRPTLAARRSLHRSQLFKEAGPLKIPAPINTQVVSPSPVLDSYDTIHSSALLSDTPQVLTDDIREGKEGNWLRSRKMEKRARSPRKWNFFQRTHVTSKTSERKPPSGNDSVSEVPVTISRIPASRPVAHYAMLDNSDQGGSSSTVDLMSNVEHRPRSPLSDTFFMNRQFNMDPLKRDHKLSMLLPSPPKLTREFNILQGPPSPLRLPGPAPSHEFPFPSPTTIVPQSEPFSLISVPAEEPPRPAQPRLRQVGRIPRVISKRERERAQAPAQHSNFSRPFMRPVALRTEVPPTTARFPDLQPTLRPVLGVQTEILQSRPWVIEDDSAKAKSAPVDASTGFSPPSGVEFLTFPTRKGSEVSGSSSSGILNFAATTAVVPQPGIVAEDEVWNEYDELLDIIESPPPLVNAKRNRTAPTPLHLRKESHLTGLDAPPAIATSSPTGIMAPIGDLPLPPRRSRLLTQSTPESAEMVSTPLSFSDFFAGYGDRNRASAASKRQSISSGSRYSAQSRTSGVGSQRRSTRVSASISGSPQRTSNSQHSRNSSSEKKRNTVIMAERTLPTSGAETNLRFSALMTSRWLSFGRVLFSPAHMEIQSNLHNRVLVLDGLGNDDWSFYCALTYPNATVYNLSPSSSTNNNNSNIQSPSNHRQIYHTSLSHRFPFPKAFFTAAVFRFPTASSESASYNAISECKRVLRPGGYLEMSILDLDMVNMGNRARRAVRQLKVRMQTADTNISLKPASDNIQKMLGRRGYENLNRCMVNVPIAGRHISTSRSGSFSTESTSDQEDTKDVSLGDMLKESPTSQGDEGISKIVAKVGRWWYTRCYESAILAKGNDDEQGESIWEDKQLLKECEKRETGLKLLICFAQKPEGVRRRTVSM